MAEKKDGQFVNIDIGDLFNTGDTRSIRNFYLSEDSFGGRFPEEGTSFMFNGFSIILDMFREDKRQRLRGCPRLPPDPFS